MSERFKAARKVLLDQILYLQTYSPVSVWEKEVPDLHAAIRLLEAAQGVDKRESLELIEAASRKYGAGRFDKIRALFDALPDEKEEGK